jgi:eukaryotic-like serine/threonine-protein kinase
VLEGSVRRENQRARITARLIDVRDQTQLWTEVFDRDLATTLQTEHEVALRVASSLAMTVLAEFAPPRMPVSDAYDHYLRGRYLRLRVTESSLRRAIQHFEEAIAIDPDYADAHAGLADALLTLGAPGWEIDPPGPTLTRAMAAADRAIGLAPRHADALTVRALIRLDLDGNRAGAEQDVRDGLAINPSLARGHLYYSSILAATGRFDEAVREAEAAHALDPLNPGSGTTLGIRLYYAGRYQDALAAMDRVLDTDGNFAPAQVGRGQALRELGQLAASIDAFERAVATGDGSTYYDARLGHAYAIGGRVTEARTVLARLEAASRNRYVSPFHFALVHAGLNDEAEVMAWLRRCREDRSGWITWLGVEREFRALLNKPAFAEFVR